VKPTESVASKTSKPEPKGKVEPMGGVAQVKQNGTAKLNAGVKPNAEVTSLAQKLQELQRQRVIYIKSRIMMSNRLQALVAGMTGYCSGLSEAERKVKFAEAAVHIKAVLKDSVESPAKSIIVVHNIGIEELLKMQAAMEKEMLIVAGQLPVAEWVADEEQRGFGLLSLATVVGETGDLNNYANPAKVWRRMGCAPWQFNDVTLSGASWKSGKDGKLPSVEWEAFGYSPRRRSVAYVIGENIIKQNGDGPYRARWLEAKQRVFETHPEWNWTPCTACKNAKSKRDDCPTCGGTGHKCGRAHNHGMLLATKLLLKNLWIEWTQ
jgi:hypothetical protein